MNRWPNLTLNSREDLLLSAPPRDLTRPFMTSTHKLLPIMERPKRPLSSYNLFFKAERRRLLDELPPPPPGKKPKHSHGKLNFDNMAKIIGFRWRNIDPASKAYYDDLALDDKIRYERAMKAYREVEEQQQEMDIVRMLLEPRPLPPNHEHDPINPIPFDFHASVSDMCDKLDRDTVDFLIQTLL